MEIMDTQIPDVKIIENRLFRDDRGYFYESYNPVVFKKSGITADFIQDNHVSSKRGVVRGLHYQVAPSAQAKLVRVIKGSIFDVAVDIRKGSATFGQHIAVTLQASEHRMIYVPVGFAHGYCALEEGTEVLYKVSGLYSPAHERGILWNDSSLGIKWPLIDTGYLVSDKDKKLPVFNEVVPV